MTKRWLAVILPASRSTEAVIVAGYNRDGKVITGKIGRRKCVGFAVDYYPEEKLRTLKDYGKSSVGDFATMQEAHTKVEQVLGGKA